jgi:hypothetical protein
MSRQRSTSWRLGRRWTLRVGNHSGNQVRSGHGSDANDDSGSDVASRSSRRGHVGRSRLPGSRTTIYETTRGMGVLTIQRGRPVQPRSSAFGSSTSRTAVNDAARAHSPLRSPTPHRLTAPRADAPDPSRGARPAGRTTEWATPPAHPERAEKDPLTQRGLDQGTLAGMLSA